MKKRLKKVAPLQLGIVLALLYAMLGLLVAPVFLLVSMFTAKTDAAGSAMPMMIGGMIGILFVPIIYGILGFIGGVLMAFVYNLAAKLTGGIEVTFEDVP
jgi:hypothetical protein